MVLDEIAVRPAVPEDAEAISNLNGEVQALHAEALPELFKPASPAVFPTSQVLEIIADSSSTLLVSAVGKEVVGYVYGHLIDRVETSLRYPWTAFEISHIVIRSEYRGQGIGHRLMVAICQEARNRGLRFVTLDFWSFNMAAQNFFEAEGFKSYREMMWLDTGSGLA
jgi:ribosomal protein S18 acetylase RimI-like enzyme